MGMASDKKNDHENKTACLILQSPSHTPKGWHIRSTRLRQRIHQSCRISLWHIAPVPPKTIIPVMVMASRRRTQNLIAHWPSRYMPGRGPKHLNIVADEWLPWCSTAPVRVDCQGWSLRRRRWCVWQCGCGHRPMPIATPGPGRHGRSTIYVCVSRRYHWIYADVCLHERKEH